MFNQVYSSKIQEFQYSDEFYAGEQDSELLPDCPERDLIIYHLLRMVRDLYINSKDGGRSGAYRKQCRTRRKSALTAILSQSEEPMKFRWACRILGFNPDVFRNRILFDVQNITDLMRDGVRLCNNNERKSLTDAEAWLWDESPSRYQLSEKKGHYVIKISKVDAAAWIESLRNSPLEFNIEQYDLTTDNTILILRHK
jgi:hypothetical protein